MNKMSLWLLRLLPMWDYICPKCRKEVKQKTHKCPFCGENYGTPLRVPPKILKDSKALEAYVHQKIFPRISASQREYLTQFFTIYFSDGFETGDFSKWTNAWGPPSIVTSPVHSGNYAMQASSIGQGGGYTAMANKLLAAESELYGRCYAYFSSVPSDTSVTHFFRFESHDLNAKLISVGVSYDGTNNRFKFYYWNGTSTVYIEGGSNSNGTNPVVGKWFCVDIHYKIDAVNGKAELWVNGINIFSYTGMNTTGYASDLGNIDVGIYTFYEDFQGVWYIDDVVAADGYIGPMGGAFKSVRSGNNLCASSGG